MHPETSEPPVNSAAEPSLEESAGDHGDAGPGVRKEGAITPGSQGGEGSCPSHMPIYSAGCGDNQHPHTYPSIQLQEQLANPLKHAHPHSHGSASTPHICPPIHCARPLLI